MDPHGETLLSWPAPPGSERTEEQWAVIAGQVRHAANKLGAPLPACLPGEPRECGRSAQQHALAWAAEVKARSHHLIEVYAPSAEAASYAAGSLYKERLAALRVPTA
ncbi:hypothetical protein OOK31_25640 [Streptomyces sp. NBC_00249]|uniref:hypothetical protein n=1 Tax=Streptomyces sp. NBC_00249 TaxID=2975690 RepID=UPI002250C75F|nr:hypothetical protein [Streptomyces sp. NBC_00249]MCX5197241.1 hypothetical protein [Streptomyces sp. NBC_00249]